MYYVFLEHRFYYSLRVFVFNTMHIHDISLINLDVLSFNRRIQALFRFSNSQAAT